MAEAVTVGRVIGARPGNVNALRHGAFSERETRRVAVACKRRLLRQTGLKVSDFDGPGRALLDVWARSMAKVEILDEHFDRLGFLDDAGAPRPGASFYFTALNCAARTLAKLADHLAVIDRHPVGDLAEAGRRVRLAAVAD